MQTLVLCAAALPIALFCAYALVRGDTETRARSGREAISVSATFAQTWQQDRETVHLLRGQCQIVQGGTTIRAEQMVVWRRPASPQNPARERASDYSEEAVRTAEPGTTITERALMLDLVPDAGVKLRAKRPITGQPGNHDPTYQHAVARRGTGRKGTVRQVQHLPAAGEP